MSRERMVADMESGLTTPEEYPVNDAMRAYMHGLNRAAAVAMGFDPDRICPECGEESGTPHPHEAQVTEVPTEYQGKPVVVVYGRDGVSVLGYRRGDLPEGHRAAMVVTIREAACQGEVVRAEHEMIPTDAEVEAAATLFAAWDTLGEAYRSARALVDAREGEEAEHKSHRFDAYLDQVFDSTRMLGMRSIGEWIEELAETLDPRAREL